jgi:UDP-N-acetylglucosamine--dolichyl-phosphate N-acetylglucosaminephosphotransferase
MMGLISALVYLLALINFLPFAFKRDIVEVTSGGGNKDYVIQVSDVEAGRFLHRFPLEKVIFHARRTKIAIRQRD